MWQWDFPSSHQLISISAVPTSWSWSWSSSCSRLTVEQLIWVSGLPLGPLTRFYLALLFSSDSYFILLSKASSLTRKRVCSLHCNHSLVPITVLYHLIWDWVPFLTPLTTRRDYGGGILTRLHTGQPTSSTRKVASVIRLHWKYWLSSENYHSSQFFVHVLTLTAKFVLT
jgi:hypothetical protein